jgi:hypothetical protein
MRLWFLFLSISGLDIGDHYNPNEPDYMRFRVYGGTNEVSIFSDPDFPLSLSATVERPDGSTQTLSFGEQADGTWRSNQAIEVALAGDYNWKLTGTSPSARPDIGQTEQFTPTGRFSVRPVQRFNIQILEPQPGDSVNLLRIAQGQIFYEPFEVLIQPQAVDSGNLVSLAEPNNGTSPFWIKISNSTQESSAIPVTYDSTRSAWVAKVTPGENGVPVLLGAQTLTVELNSAGYNRTDFRPSAASGGQASIQINRTIQLNGGRILSPGGAVAQYDEEPFYDPEAPVRFRYQITGYAGSTGLAASLPLERLKVEMSVSNPNQNAQTQELVSVGDGVWESSVPLVLPVAGGYEWDVTVSARNAILVPKNKTTC